MRLFLKDNYLNAFKTIKDKLSDSANCYTSFVKLWHKVCKDECNNVRNSIKSLIVHELEDLA